MPTAADEPPPFPFKAIEFPPMPASEAEWRAHWAFYKITLAQRDQAWIEVSDLRRLLERLGSPSMPPDPEHPEYQSPLWGAP